MGPQTAPQSLEGELCPEVCRTQPAARTFPSTQVMHTGPTSPMYTTRLVSLVPFHTHAHMHTCPPHSHTTHTCTPSFTSHRARFLHVLIHTHSPHNRQHLHTQTDTDRRRELACQEPPAVLWPGQAGSPGHPSLLPAQALYLALRCRLQLLGRQLRIDLPSMGHWRLGPGCPC